MPPVGAGVGPLARQLLVGIDGCRRFTDGDFGDRNVSAGRLIDRDRGGRRLGNRLGGGGLERRHRDCGCREVGEFGVGRLADRRRLAERRGRRWQQRDRRVEDVVGRGGFRLCDRRDRFRRRRVRERGGNGRGRARLFDVGEKFLRGGERIVAGLHPQLSEQHANAIDRASGGRRGGRGRVRTGGGGLGAVFGDERVE